MARGILPQADDVGGAGDLPAAFDPTGYPGADGGGFRDPDSPGAALRRRLAAGAEALRGVLRGLDLDGFGSDPQGLLGEAVLGFAGHARRRRIAPRLVLRLFAERLARGRPALGLGWAETGIAPLGRRRRGRSGGFWQPAPDGEGHEVVLLPAIAWCLGARAECYEILALDAQDAGLWWRRTGAASVLGLTALERAMREAGPVTLAPSPLAWARAGGEASGQVCLLDLEAPAAREALLAAVEIRCADTQHGKAVERLQKKLRPKLPGILVARAEAAP